MNADNRRGILAMSLAMALFIANDALVKQVSASLPGPQLIFIRGLMATTLVLIMAQAMGHLKNWRMMLNVKLWLRGAVDAMASLTYLTAVFHLPLANATRDTLTRAIGLHIPALLITLSTAVSVAMRACEMSLVAPFRYSDLLFALLIGYVVWDEVPNLVAWLGIGLLVISGLLILRAERQ